MRFPLRLLLVLLISAAGLRADDLLAEARLAQRLLGEAVWSRVVRIETSGGWRRESQVRHALVFELAGILWYYTAPDGTRSLSRHLHRVEAEKLDLEPLLRQIVPKLTRWELLPADFKPAGPGGRRLTNGCFIESVVVLRAQLAGGGLVLHPRLLFYYSTQSWGGVGHTVLVFERAGGIEVIDPLRPDDVRRFSRALADNPVALARALEGPRVASARVWPLDSLMPRTELANAASRSPESEVEAKPARAG